MKIDYQHTDIGTRIRIWKREKDGTRRAFTIGDFKPSFYVPDPNGTFMSTDHNRLREVVVNFPREVPLLRKGYPVHYQADVMFRDKFLIDSEPSRIESFFDEGEHRIVYLDTEAIKIDGVWNLICWSIYDSYTKEYETHLQALAPIEKLDEVLARWDRVFLYQDGKSLLKAFFARIMELDPDIITGWNIQWDMVEPIIKYANSLGANINVLSPDGIVTITQGRNDSVLIHGRDIFDMLFALRKMTLGKEKSYTLRHIMMKYLGMKKPDHRGNFLNLLLNNPVELVRYNRDVDTVAIVKLDKKLGITSTFLEQHKEYQCQLNSLFAVSTVIDIGLQRSTDLKRPSRGQTEGFEQRGPLNIKPKRGVYHGALTIDFKGMYSTIMMSYNMSPETLNPDGDLQIGNGMGFDSKPEGLMTAFIRRTIEKKDHYTKLRDEAKKSGDTEAYRIYKARRELYKVISNATYGVTASNKTGWYSPQIAASILYIARQLLGKCIKKLEKKGYKVVYAHTDSMTVIVGWEGEKEFLKTCGEITDWLNAEINEIAKGMGLHTHIFEVGQDYKWRKIVLSGKHNQYAGYLVDGEFVTMGLIKGIFSKYAEEFTTTLIKRILDEEKREDVIDWVEAEIHRIADSKISLLDLAFLHTLRKTPEEYKKRNSYVDGIAFSNEKYGFNIDYSDTVKFIPAQYMDVNSIAVPMYCETVPLGIEPDWKRIISLNIRSRARDLLKVIRFDIEDKEVWMSLLPDRIRRRRKRMKINKTQTKLEDWI